MDHRYPFLAAGKSVVFHKKLGAYTALIPILNCVIFGVRKSLQSLAQHKQDRFLRQQAKLSFRCRPNIFH